MDQEKIKTGVEVMREAIRDRAGELRNAPRTPEVSVAIDQLERDYDEVMAIALRARGGL